MSRHPSFPESQSGVPAVCDDRGVAVPRALSLGNPVKSTLGLEAVDIPWKRGL
jgi:hypothetical protein